MKINVQEHKKEPFEDSGDVKMTELLDEIINKISKGRPNSSVYIGKDYSVADLIEDLLSLNKNLGYNPSLLTIGYF